MSDQIVIPFPCFVIMDKNCKGSVVQPMDDGQIAVVILTSEERLRQYRVEHKCLGPTIRFEFDFQLYYYLRSVPALITQIMIDPEKNQAMTWQRAL